MHNDDMNNDDLINSSINHQIIQRLSSLNEREFYKMNALFRYHRDSNNGLTNAAFWMNAIRDFDDIAKAEANERGGD